MSGTKNRGGRNGHESLPASEDLDRGHKDFPETHAADNRRATDIQRLITRNLALEKENQMMESEIEELQQRQDAIKRSKWLKLGRWLGCGPNLE